jgi:G:T/U-mismatch repair DNA glycosylase
MASSSTRLSPRRKATSVAVTAAAAAIVTPEQSVGFAPAPVTSRYFAKQHDHSVLVREKSSRLFSESTTASAASAPANDPAKKPKIERTQSFEPVWHGSMLHAVENSGGSMADVSDVHTIVLGTHPSIASLTESQYFGHTQNAFWWIAGDCLGFRRQLGVSAEGKPYKLTQYLRYGESRVLPYDQQLQLFTSKGFALWDIIKSCERKGSLDADIKNEEPNDIWKFCKSHTTVRRIVLANGGTGCTMFNRHFKDWWLSGELKPGSNAESEKAFDKFAKKTDNFRDANIEVISALSVSPAAARYSYEEKRKFWEDYVYGPGLRDHEELKKR